MGRRKGSTNQGASATPATYSTKTASSVAAASKAEKPTRAQTEATNPPEKKRKRPNKKASDVVSRAEIANDSKGPITDETPGRPPKKGPMKRGGHYKGGPGGGAVSDAEQLFRLRIVEQAIIDGKRGGQIAEALREKGRKLPGSTIQMYQRRVRDKWAHEDSLLRPIWRERQMRKLHDVAARLERGGYWGHWVAVQKLIADLEGNLAPVKVEHKQVEEFDGWTVEELEAYVESKGQTRPLRFSERRGGPGTADQEWGVSQTPGPDTLH